MAVTEAFQEMLSVTGKTLRTMNYSIDSNTQKVGEGMMFGPLAIAYCHLHAIYKDKVGKTPALLTSQSPLWPRTLFLYGVWKGSFQCSFFFP